MTPKSPTAFNDSWFHATLVSFYIRIRTRCARTHHTAYSTGNTVYNERSIELLCGLSSEPTMYTTQAQVSARHRHTGFGIV